MPAPDYQTCFAIEGPVENFFVALLDGNLSSLTWQVLRAHDRYNLRRMGVIVRLNLGPQTGHMAKPPLLSKRVPDSYTGQVILSVITSKSEPFADHETLRSEVRALVAQAQPAQRLTYHDLLDIAPGASQPPEEEAPGHHTTHLIYDVVLAIRPDAWPTS